MDDEKEKIDSADCVVIDIRDVEELLDDLLHCDLILHWPALG